MNAHRCSPCWLFALSFFFSLNSNAQGVIATYAGRDRAFNGDGQQAKGLFLSKIQSVSLDASGNPVFAVQFRNVVLRLNPDGTVKRLAGTGETGASGDNAMAINAQLNAPQSVAYDSIGNLYIADTGNNRIRKVGTDGNITTFAGGFNAPTGIVVDGLNNVYVNDEGNKVVRRITPQGVVSPYAGGGTGAFQQNQPALAVAFGLPAGIALDHQANLYVTDMANHRVIKVDANTHVATNVAGTGVAGKAAENAVAATSPLNSPGGVAVDSTGNLYISDTGNFQIRVVNASGTITTLVGNGQVGFSGDGGPAIGASLNATFALALDAQANLFLADRDNFRIRRVDATSRTITTVAGNGTAFDNGVPATSLLLFSPSGVSFGTDGSLYICDLGSDIVRKVDATGTAFTVAGTGAQGFGGDLSLAAAAELSFPFSSTMDSSGNLFIADSGNNAIRKIDSNGVITTVAGIGGSAGYNGDTIAATQALLNQPTAVAVDASGNIFIADLGNNRVRRVTNGVITTVAGPSGLNGPLALAFRNNNLLIADAGNSRILSLPPNGSPSTFFTAMGNVYGVATDASGNVYFTDATNSVVQRIGSGGVATPIAGTGKAGFSGDGGSATQAQLNTPYQVAVDAAGNVFIADYGNNRVRVVYAKPPTFQTTPAAVTFSAPSGGLPLTQSVSLTGSLAGLNYSLSISPPAPWLTVTPVAGQMPASLSVTADPSQLQPGSYDAVVTIASPFATPMTLTLPVHFAVGAAQPAKLATEASQLVFSSPQQGAPSSRTVQISNSGGGTLNFKAAVSTSNGGSWLQVSSTTGTATPAQAFPLTVSADPTGLAPGSYVGSIALTNVAGSDGSTIAVSLLITSTQQTMVLSQTGLTFTGVQSGGAVPAQSFEVVNTGQGTLTFTASVSSTSPWLSVSPGSGSSTGGSKPQSVSVQVNVAGLVAGIYYGQVTVKSPNAANSPQFLTIVFQVLPPGQNPGPVVQPSGIIFSAVAGGANPLPQTVTVSNLTSTPLTMGSSETFVGVGNWFVHDPTNATIVPSSPLTITINPLIAGLLPGVYQGALSLAFSDGSVRAVAIRLIIAAGAPAQGNSYPTATAAASCTPKALVPVFTSVADTFAIPGGFPEAIVVRVADDCGTPLTQGTVRVSFTNGDTPLSLVSLQDGRWSGTWTPIHPVTPVTVTAKAQSAALTGMLSITGGLQNNSDPPLITPEGVISATNSSAGAPLAVGALISIYGQNLSGSTAGAVGLPLETSLQGVSVQMGSMLLPLLYVSSSQINAIVPYELLTNVPQPLLVSRGSHLSTTIQVPLADTLPSVFTANGQGIVVDPKGVLYDASHPAHAGDIGVIYCTGLGTVTGGVPAGSASPSSPPATTTNAVTVTVGGQPAQVQFSGLTPGYAGLYQINVVIPAGVASGNALPVVVREGGRSSAPAVIAVQ